MRQMSHSNYKGNSITVTNTIDATLPAARPDCKNQHRYHY